MSEDEGGAAVDEELAVECWDLDAGTGTQSFEFGADWVEYLAGADLPENVTGIDYSIEDFGEEAVENA